MAEPLRGFSFLYNMAGGQPMVIEVPVKVSQTFSRGNVCCYSRTSGSIRVAAEADTSLLGVIEHSKSTTATQTTATAQVIPFVPGYVFSVVGAPSTMTTARYALRNLHADLEIPTTLYHRVDTGAATNHFRIIGWDKTNETTTGAGRTWYVTIVPAVSQFVSTEAD